MNSFNNVTDSAIEADVRHMHRKSNKSKNFEKGRIAGAECSPGTM